MTDIKEYTIEDDGVVWDVKDHGEIVEYSVNRRSPSAWLKKIIGNEIVPFDVIRKELAKDKGPDKHVCSEPNYCICEVWATEPDDKCPSHGIPWPPRCGECGRFMNWDPAKRGRG